MPHTRAFASAGLAIAAACSPYPRIACTPGPISACFGFDIAFHPLPGDSTRITIRIQDLQGTIPADNAAWSQLLYLRVYRNMNPPLGFPDDGPAVPTWDPAVQPIGPAPAGSGWHNTGANSPSFVSEWVGTGGTYGTNVGYVAGRDSTYNEVSNIGAGLRTYTAAGTAPGWVTFNFVAQRPVRAADVGVQLSAWASQVPAASLPVPQQVGCQLVAGGGPIGPACHFLDYNLP